MSALRLVGRFFTTNYRDLSIPARLGYLVVAGAVYGFVTLVVVVLFAIALGIA